MTNTEWVQLNMITGEVKPLKDERSKQHRHDVAFDAAMVLWGYAGQPLTDSLRGACNKSLAQIKRYEREVDPDVTLEEIADRIIGFRSWFIRHRLERFNETCRRPPYPMETCKIWPDYRRDGTDKARKFDADKERLEEARRLRDPLIKAIDDHPAAES